jgi:hypothetical protein
VGGRPTLEGQDALEACCSPAYPSSHNLPLGASGSNRVCEIGMPPLTELDGSAETRLQIKRMPLMMFKVLRYCTRVFVLQDHFRYRTSVLKE